MRLQKEGPRDKSATVVALHIPAACTHDKLDIKISLYAASDQRIVSPAAEADAKMEPAKDIAIKMAIIPLQTGGIRHPSESWDLRRIGKAFAARDSSFRWNDEIGFRSTCPKGISAIFLLAFPSTYLLIARFEDDEPIRE
ncbi:hypothetical protein [Parasphingopyxis sp.]|uniref:hypothetical protein n=1 Tax=Parasphingopyxis sp. TaxID=1920299 RepID=UPI00263802B4|nr:hypothetical protein [Parasphingopyxis sp.]